MNIPRLPSDQNSFQVNITISKKLRPYLTAWFMRNKRKGGETPEQFILRAIIRQAHVDYVSDVGKIEQDTVEKIRKDSTDLLSVDADLLLLELNQDSNVN